MTEYSATIRLIWAANSTRFHYFASDYPWNSNYSCATHRWQKRSDSRAYVSRVCKCLKDIAICICSKDICNAAPCRCRRLSHAASDDTSSRNCWDSSNTDTVLCSRDNKNTTNHVLKHKRHHIWFVSVKAYSRSTGVLAIQITEEFRYGGILIENMIFFMKEKTKISTNLRQNYARIEDEDEKFNIFPQLHFRKYINQCDYF